MDVDLRLIGSPLDFNLGYPCEKESTLNKLFNLEILM